jgi:hypothetical protein
MDSMGGVFDNSGTFSNWLSDPMDLSGERGGKTAAAAQTHAANQADATLRYMYDTQRKDLAPSREMGLRAAAQIEDPNFMKNWQKDPGYEFRLAEGQKAINASASARGMGNSGATMKALTQYGQDHATNEYNNVYNRNYQRLSGLAGIGNASTQTGVGAAGQFGAASSSNQIGLGNAMAAQQVAQTAGKQQMAGAIGGAIFSDSRLKTNLEEISATDLAEMQKHLKAYAFNYTSAEFGDGDWVGVMAQDLEKSKLGRTLVIEDEFGNKTIDQKKVLSMFLATLAVK